MENILKFNDLSKAKSPLRGLGAKLMSIKTDSTLKTTVETVAAQTTKKGSINARNLLDMAFKNKKVKESYHFPQNNNNARLIINIITKSRLTIIEK